MSFIMLSNRLKTIADMVPPKASAADIGTDHARLPVWLMQNGAEAVIATEINKKPYIKAEKFIKHCGLEGKISLRLGDGLKCINKGEVNCVIIAGMSGETIAGILSAAEWMPEFEVTLLLQPMTKETFLRKYLCENGYEITREKLCRDNDRKRLFLVIEARAGRCNIKTEADYICGIKLGGDPLYTEYLDKIYKRTIKALKELKNTQGKDRLKEGLNMLAGHIISIKDSENSDKNKGCL